MSRFFRIYLVPGFIFQSLVIGGGYGTGREIVEFFLNEGPLSGLLGILVSTLIWSGIMAITFEWARLTKSYDYKSLVDKLLGKAWIGYEIFYLSSLILIVSVLGSASGEIAQSLWGIPSIYGVIMMMVGVGILAFYGSKIIERVLSFWSIALYLVYGALIVITFREFGDDISDSLSGDTADGAWFTSGLRYASYNIGILPAVLFVARHFENRKQAIGSGIIGGVLAIIPGILMYLSLLSQYPDVLNEAIPSEYLLSRLPFPMLSIVFQLILLGTFIETGVGIIHGFNERINGALARENKSLSHIQRLLLAIVLLLIAIFLADVIGIINLIAKGYNLMAWVALLVFVIPMSTLGLYRIIKGRK